MLRVFRALPMRTVPNFEAPARLRRCTRRRRRKGPQNGHRVLQGMLLQTLSLSQGLAASARTLCKRISEGAKDVLCDNHAPATVSTFDGRRLVSDWVGRFQPIAQT